MSQENTTPEEPWWGPCRPDRTPKAARAAEAAGAWVPVEPARAGAPPAGTPSEGTPSAGAGTEEAPSKEAQHGSQEAQHGSGDPLEELEESAALGASVDDAFAHLDTRRPPGWTLNGQRSRRCPRCRRRPRRRSRRSTSLRPAHRKSHLGAGGPAHRGRFPNAVHRLPGPRGRRPVPYEFRSIRRREPSSPPS